LKLISATGSNKPDEDEIISERKGNSAEGGSQWSRNFLIGKMDDNGIQATAKTAQIFSWPFGSMHPMPQPSIQ